MTPLNVYMYMLVSLPHLITSIYCQRFYKINISSWYRYVAGSFKKNLRNLYT